VVLAREELAHGGQLNFTRRYESGWENIDHVVGLGTVAAGALPQIFPEISRRNAA
jgi:hypothetical protein